MFGRRDTLHDDVAGGRILKARLLHSACSDARVLPTDLQANRWCRALVKYCHPVDSERITPGKRPPAGSRRPWQAALDIVGARVRSERERHGWSARELARRAGLDSAVISRLEAAAGDARLSTLFVVAAALEVPPSSLIRDLPEA